MVSPAFSGDHVFEDESMKVSMAVIDDRVLQLDITNKTGESMTIIWGDSTMVDAGGDAGRPAAVTAGGQSGADVTYVPPGQTFSARLYPASHVYMGKDGEEVHPFYYKGGLEGAPDDLKDSPIGIKLPMEISGHARLMQFMLQVRPADTGARENTSGRKTAHSGYPDFMH